MTTLSQDTAVSHLVSHHAVVEGFFSQFFSSFLLLVVLTKLLLQTLQFGHLLSYFLFLSLLRFQLSHQVSLLFDPLLHVGHLFFLLVDLLVDLHHVCNSLID